MLKFAMWNTSNGCDINMKLFKNDGQELVDLFSNKNNVEWKTRAWWMGDGLNYSDT